MFRICDRKGFHVQFDNGWTVSVQFGRGNYGSNYDHDSYDSEVPPADTAEVAAWPDSGGMAQFEEGDTVAGHYDSARVLKLMNEVAALPSGPFSGRLTS